jgi:hypothetical protein
LQFHANDVVVPAPGNGRTRRPEDLIQPSSSSSVESGRYLPLPD